MSLAENKQRKYRLKFFAAHTILFMETTLLIANQSLQPVGVQIMYSITSRHEP